MSNIEWKEDSVCFAAGTQWDSDNDFSDALNCKDFQLNTIKQGDYIEALELDNQKYNDAVEVFMLFGFEWGEGAVDSYNDVISMGSLTICHDGIFATEVTPKWCARKITFNQLMAIGELRRLEIERDNDPQFGKNEDGSMKIIKSNFSENPNSCKDGGKYHREIIGLDGTKTTVDVYRILDAFKTGCAATDHAVKKMLCAGLRGHKDKLTDYDNAIESLQAAKELLIQKSNNENAN